MDIGVESSNTATYDSGRCQVMREIVLRNHLERLLKNFPQLDGFVIRREEEMRCVLSSTPFDLVYFFFDFK